MSLSNSLPQLERAFRELKENVEKSVNSLRDAMESVIRSALTDDKTPLQSALALRQALESAGYEDSFDIVVFGDLNGFKTLNESYGHAAGDFAIQHIGTLIQKLFVEECQAKAFHPSGDEFIILLRHKFLKKFKTLTANFAECEFDFEEQQLKTAISFGYAIREVETDFETLLARAEVACRKAKTQGGGEFVQWTKELASESFEERRETCPNCHSIIACNIPRKNIVQELKVCPVCQKPLTKTKPPASANQRALKRITEKEEHKTKRVRRKIL